jgi:uncharacterized protein GlcG (DUF336 family)
MKTIFKIILLAIVLQAPWASADNGIPDVITTKKMSMELAAAIAGKAVKVCRGLGFQVTAVVVDRSGNAQVIMRDVYASRFTIQMAHGKANAAILGGVSTGEMFKNRQDIRPELNHVDGILVLPGGLPIFSGGYMVGAIGVSGAPTGDSDEACAQKALKSVQERLDFAD